MRAAVVSHHKGFDRAAALPHHTGRLSTLHAALPAQVRHSPLADAPAMTRRVETGFRTMWHAWCNTSA
jgi:predicted O-linked N-acetylglucosamine transferase (SPINDLY family)